MAKTNARKRKAAKAKGLRPAAPVQAPVVEAPVESPVEAVAGTAQRRRRAVPAPVFGGRMVKKDLVEAVAHREGVSVAQANAMVDAVFDTVVRQLVAGGSVMLTGLGTLASVQRAERVARNPQTGEPVPVPPRTGVSFRVGSGLAEILNGERALPEVGRSALEKSNPGGRVKDASQVAA